MPSWRGEKGRELAEVDPNPLPQALLVQEYAVIPERDARLAAMRAPTFNPRDTVILEEEPNPRPDLTETRGRVAVVDESTDHLTIEADLPGAAILLVTDAYAPGWRAWTLGDGPQERYEVMPANHTLRAIPLAAGRHRLHIEYLPWGYRVGRWVSIVSVLAFAGAVMAYRRRHRTPPVEAS